MIAGDPEDCLKALLALRQATGIDSIRLIFNCNGEVSDQDADVMATLFAQEVLPALHSEPPMSIPSMKVFT
jgi:alkanesulfonate monooxygenase SsuD/methylene tetrahydromethanopterin reductase-like flavin-dependent oxidoreductase (luciferase family)